MNKNARGKHVLLTEGITVFGSEMVKSRKFNTSYASVYRVCRFFLAQYKCDDPGEDAAGNYYRLPDKPRCENEVGCCSKRGQQPDQRCFSHSNASLGQRQDGSQLRKWPRKKPVAQG